MGERYDFARLLNIQNSNKNYTKMNNKGFKKVYKLRDFFKILINIGLVFIRVLNMQPVGTFSRLAKSSPSVFCEGVNWLFS